MTIDSIDRLLNDSEINYLADLYLACYGFDRGSRRYRYLKNAVIIAANGILSYRESIPHLARCARVEPEYYVSELNAALDLDVPVYETFNSVFCWDDGETIKMKSNKKADYVVPFLGKTFMYVLVRNYPKTGRIVLSQKQN